ncbi:MAG: SURF1 family protein, partial [Burkholderiales bacterium]
MYSKPTMIRGMGVGNWRFRPRFVPGIAAAGFIALTLALGHWQTRRAEEKIELGRRLDAAEQGPVLSVPAAPAQASLFDHRRVSARGIFVARATLFLDNKVMHGVAGYHVLTPLRIEGSEVHVLVNRGWIAAGERSKLPAVSTPRNLQTVEGLALTPSSRFIALAPEAPSGPRIQNLVLEREEKRLGLQLQPFVVEQILNASDGLSREWARPDRGVDRHRTYALQWYSFAALAAI